MFHLSRLTICFLLFVFCFFLVACAPFATINRGTLEGHVTFTGSGANAAQPAPTPAPEFYEQHSLIIYFSDASTLVTNVLLDGQGNYHVDLDPGVYVVKWRGHNVETADLPKSVTIESGKTTRLDVNVDAGIR